MKLADDLPLTKKKKKKLLKAQGTGEKGAPYVCIKYKLYKKKKYHKKVLLFLTQFLDYNMRTFIFSPFREQSNYIIKC